MGHTQVVNKGKLVPIPIWLVPVAFSRGGAFSRVVCNPPAMLLKWMLPIKKSEIKSLQNMLVR